MGRITSSNLSGSFTLKYNPYQQRFLNALDARYDDGVHKFHRYGIFAGRRGGKTAIGAVAAVKKASEANTLGWCIAPTYPELHDYVIPAFFRVIPNSWIPKNGWSAEFNELTLKNGSKVAFRSAEDPERMRGPGCHWAWFDECRKIKKLAWDTFRPALTEHRGIAWFTTSPNGYDWAYKAFYRRAMPGYYQKPGYWACRYKTSDNPVIPREEIEEARETMDEAFFRQEYEAEFVRFEGSIYGDTINACIFHPHEIDRIKKHLPWYPNPNRDWPFIVGLDPGADHPFGAVGMLVAPEGLVPWREYRKRLSVYSDHATNIREMTHGFNDVRYAMDRTATQAFIEMATHGITASAAENSVLLGIQRVQSWLRTKKMYLMESHVPMLIEEMTNYHWHDAPAADEERGTERVFKLDDDLCDGLRYGTMLWPELPTPAKPMVGRDPATVPEELRWAWEREKKCDRLHDENETDWTDDLTPMHDFFAQSSDDFEGGYEGGFFHAQ